MEMGWELACAVGQVKVGKNKQIKVDLNACMSTCQFLTKNQTLANADSLFSTQDLKVHFSALMWAG